MPISNEKLHELAKAYFTTDTVDLAQLEQLQLRIEELQSVFAMEDGASEDSALEQAMISIEAGIRSRKSGGTRDMRTLHYGWIKEVCLTKSPGASVSAPEVYEHAKSKHGYKALDAKGIGDSMGRGCGKGLYLEPTETSGHKKLYRVPDPNKYTDLQQRGDVHVLLVQGKGKLEKDNYVVVGPDCYAHLQRYLAARVSAKSSDPLFAATSDNCRGARLGTTTLRKIAKRYLRKIGINTPRITAHSLRHTAVSLALDGGATLLECKEMARHEVITTTMGYAHGKHRLQTAAELKLEIFLRVKIGNPNNGSDDEADWKSHMCLE
jgi:hypothetical protein